MTLALASRSTRSSAALEAGSPGARDHETRDRLLRAAAGLFADRGFAETTVRTICRTARANVAAVNYHFGGKLGLYRAVLAAAIERMRATTDAAIDAGGGKAADERLRAYVQVFVYRVAGPSREQWIYQLLLREMADPTPAIDEVVNQVIEPRFRYLRNIVSELLCLPSSHEEVMRCAVSVQAQCHAALPNPLSYRSTAGRGRSSQGGSRRRDSPTDVSRLAEHIATFSLAGIEQVRRSVERRGCG